MSRFQLQEQKPLDCNSISLFVNYINILSMVTGNFFSVMQRNTTLSHYCKPNMI